VTWNPEWASLILRTWICRQRRVYCKVTHSIIYSIKKVHVSSISKSRIFWNKAHTPLNLRRSSIKVTDPKKFETECLSNLETQAEVGNEEPLRKISTQDWKARSLKLKRVWTLSRDHMLLDGRTESTPQLKSSGIHMMVSKLVYKQATSKVPSYYNP